jgi:uncharacterized protein (TIGR02001 family)
MNLNRCLFIGSLFFSQNIFASHISSKFMIVSDYVYRGVTRTDHGPSVMGDLHYNFDFGLSAGASAANVGADEARGMETRIDLSYKQMFHPLLGLRLMTEFYHNPYATNAESRNFELGLILSKYFELSASYIPKYFGSGASSLYFQATSSVEVLPSESLFLNLSGGYSKFKEETRIGSTSYFDYRVALHKKMKESEVGLFWVGTNRRIVDGVAIDKPAKDEGFGATYTIRLN